MKRVWWVFAAAVALYLPTVRYSYVQDDMLIIRNNAATHGVGAALRALDEPYWPPPSRGGMYRPLTTLSFGVDWSISGARPGWFHFMNALWHGLACALVVLVLARWLPESAAFVAGLIFAVHPVHVEGVANLVSRGELFAAVGMLGAVLAARQHRWALAVACAAAAMLSKEHAVITGVVILLDDWLQSPGARRYPTGFYVAIAGLTISFLGAWLVVGVSGDVAPPFFGATVGQRLAIGLPAVWRAATLLVWPADLVADYHPEVIPVRSGLSLPAVAGAFVVVAVPYLAWWARRRAPALAFAAAVAALAYLPTSNLLFASGVVLAERSLYLPVLLSATAAGYGFMWLERHWEARRAGLVVGLVVLVLAGRSYLRLPVWRDNKTFLLTLLAQHPESYRAHRWAAHVLAEVGDTAGALREFTRADSIFPRDPSVQGAHALVLLESGDTTGVAALAERARRVMPRQLLAVRAQFLIDLARGDRARARALADSALVWFPWEREWYRHYLQ
ncbi:MAG TPA: hypothetical protein VGQ06_09740 [Gemmatimonadales bacterium]|jgi:hypothetical protein|nr:hypothetical protein [Gemmatimonadales bacterium]